MMRNLSFLLVLLASTAARADLSPEDVLRGELHAAEVLFFEDGKAEAALAKVVAARKLVGDNLDFAEAVAYAEATFRAYLGDYRAAAAVLEGYLGRAEKARETFAVAAMANTICWVYFAMDDLDRALASNERVRRAVETGGMWAEESYGWLHHYWWDRAYLLLEKAVRAPAGKRASALARAEEARRTYLALGEASEDIFGIAALEAFFAGRLGDADRAASVARTVEWQKRGDVQDLYIWAVALELVDPASAKELRGRVAGAHYLMVPVQLRAMARDAMAYARKAKRDAARARLTEVRGYVKHDKGLLKELDRAIAAVH